MMRRLIVLALLLAAPAAPVSATDLIDQIVSTNKSVMVVTRAKTGKIAPAAAAAGLSKQAFSMVLGRTFQKDGEPLAAHGPPVPLPAKGPLVGGYVAAVENRNGRCGFAVGLLDFSGDDGAKGHDAAAALIFCAADSFALKDLADPAKIAARIARLPES